MHMRTADSLGREVNQIVRLFRVWADEHGAVTSFEVIPEEVWPEDGESCPVGVVWTIDSDDFRRMLKSGELVPIESGDRV